MKRFLLITAFLFISMLSFSQKGKKLEDQIRKFWFVMLTKGEYKAPDSAAGTKLMVGHLANIGRLYHLGKIKVAGPFGDDGPWEGLFIFDCKTKEEVEELLNTDPGIAVKLFHYEIHPWYTAEIGSFKPGKPEE